MKKPENKKLSYFNQNLIPTMDWIVFDHCDELRSKCRLVKLPLTRMDLNAIEKMTSYVDACYRDEADKYQITSGIAIAANQIGYLKRIIYVNFDSNKHISHLLINPEIIAVSKNKIALGCGEGCLSVNEKHEDIIKPRYATIKVKAIDLLTDEKKYQEFIFNGFESICIQHEIDHLNGKLYYDNAYEKNNVPKDIEIIGE